ncbi:KEOPS complex subunit Pcc1 [Candidatus Methanocrinis natronophilus]|uniref:KEOPS complex subunit Pcc1 n=1 Tax=Candidatus Methanocrinis natronophilus TaxID=3033396 RepID=A0ABT5X9V5_9EURY|nr:KEOPS complex subunit Pcc1 [Candidatus Methanocrinis natronophilus]MDF0591357.1 KEOPS complex subunit Pcc1 [Candidatus Methanocrinis natronophilus]
MIRARLRFEGEEAEAVARSLDPDNLSGMRVTVAEGAVEVEFSAERAGTILATADDLIMNAKIVLDLLNNEVRS